MISHNTNNVTDHPLPVILPPLLVRCSLSGQRSLNSRRGGNGAKLAARPKCAAPFHQLARYATQSTQFRWRFGISRQLSRGNCPLLSLIYNVHTACAIYGHCIQASHKHKTMLATYRTNKKNDPASPPTLTENMVRLTAFRTA